MCEDQPLKSDWSKTETVQQKPSKPRDAIIREKDVIVGHDACRVENLLIGAEIKIFAVNALGEENIVGGGTAAAPETIFKIDPPFKPNFGYDATQSLCKNESDRRERGIIPTRRIPRPSVQQPICDGDYYVKICDTVSLGEVRVYVNRTHVSGAAGNGGCLTVSLPYPTTFSMGDTVTARQFVAGQPSSHSIDVPVKGTGVPSYDPSFWNDDLFIRSKNNCYNYGCDIRSNTYAQPGYAHEVELDDPNMNCLDVGKAAEDDGLKKTSQKECEKCSHLVALVIAPNQDYHWYRLDDDGFWSHKPAIFLATNLDASDKKITNPETADRNYLGTDVNINYSVFCGYYCVDKKFVEIDGRG